MALQVLYKEIPPCEWFQVDALRTAPAHSQMHVNGVSFHVGVQFALLAARERAPKLLSVIAQRRMVFAPVVAAFIYVPCVIVRPAVEWALDDARLSNNKPLGTRMRAWLLLVVHGWCLLARRGAWVGLDSEFDATRSRGFLVFRAILDLRARPFAQSRPGRTSRTQLLGWDWFLSGYRRLSTMYQRS